MRQTILISTALLFIVLFLPCRTAVAEQQKGKKIVDVQVKGPDVSSAQRIKMALRTKEGDAYDPALTDQDVKNLFMRNLVEKVSVQVDDVEGGVSVTFFVVEKKVVTQIEMTPTKRIYYDYGDVKDDILSEEGEFYSFALASQDEEIIAQMFRDKGYLQVNVTHEVIVTDDDVILRFNVEQGTRYAIGEILFEGVTVFKHKKLRKVMKSHKRDLFHGGTYDPDKMSLDLERIRRQYLAKGYLDVKVELLPFELPEVPEDWGPYKRKEFEVRIRVVEGEQYIINSIVFTGETVFTSEELRDFLTVKPGDVANHKKILDDADDIREQFGERGRAFTEVNPEVVPTTEPRMVDVLFHIEQSDVITVNEVIIQGNLVTRENVVRRELEVYPGEELTVRGLQDTVQNLHYTQYYEDVSLNFRPRSRTVTDVVVTVKEQNTGRFMMGGGVSSDGDVFARISYSEINFDISNFPKFRGGGQRMNVSVHAGMDITSFNVSFTEPHVYDSDYSFSIALFRNEYERNTYTDTRYGGTISVGKKLADHLRGKVGYTYQHVTIDDIQDDAASSVVLDEGDHDLANVAIGFSYRDLDNPYIPSTGWDASFDVFLYNEVLGSDYDFYKASLSAARYIRIYTTEADTHHVLLLHTKVGHMDDMGDTEAVPTFERFYVGGINTVRGWQPREIGPREDGDPIGGYFRATMSLEYYFPLYEDMIYLAAFVDAGGCWAKIDDFEEDGIRYGTGLGVYIKTPLSPAPIRLYFTEALNPEDEEDTASFQFSFGFMF